MKKILFFAVSMLFISSSFAISNVEIKPRLKASEIKISLGQGQQISLLDLSRMSVKEVELVSGRKMKFVDRLTFRAAQHKLRQQISADGMIDSKKFIKKLQKADNGSGFNIGGFALGFLLGPIGVLIAYIIKDEKQAARKKWAWIGFGVAVAIWLIFLVI